MKIGLNNDELKQLVVDLKEGKTWAEVVRDRLFVLAPGVLEASDYQAWAHREAGLPLPAAKEAAPELVQDQVVEPPEPKPGKHKRGQK